MRIKQIRDSNFWLQNSCSLWVKLPPFLHGEIFLVSSPNQLINCLTPLLKTTSFSRIYWLAIDLVAKAACGVQGTDVCWPLKQPVVVKGLIRAIHNWCLQIKFYTVQFSQQLVLQYRCETSCWRIAQCNMGCLAIFLLSEASHEVELSSTFHNGL